MDTVEEIVDAQVHLQTALGFYRLDHGRDDHVERHITWALAQLHRLLEELGCPMLMGTNRKQSCAQCEAMPVGSRWACPDLMNHEPIEIPIA